MRGYRIIRRKQTLNEKVVAYKQSKKKNKIMEEEKVEVVEEAVVEDNTCVSCEG